MPVTVLPHRIAAIADLGVLGDRLVPAASAAFRGGLRWVVLRAKGADTAVRVGLGGELLRRCPGLFLTVHGDVEACRSLRAPGLHLPGSDPIASQTPRPLPGVLLGISCHTAEELAGASRWGADYVFLSPLFPPTSKAARGGALGPEGFSALARGALLPVLALGGMRPDRLQAACEAGASGAAVLGGLFLSPDVEGSARAWVAAAASAFPGAGATPFVPAGLDVP